MAFYIVTSCCCLLFINVAGNTFNITNANYVMKIKRNDSNNFEKPNVQGIVGGDIQGSKRHFFPPDLHRIVLAINALPIDSACRNDSETVFEAVASRERWALKMFDSSPKFPVGMLYGSYYQLGNYDECLSIKEQLANDDRLIQGQYCMADIVLDSHNDEDKERISRSHGRFHLQTPTTRFAFNNTLRWAICVPSSCKPEEVVLFLEELLDLAISYKAISIHLPERKCHYEKAVALTELEIAFATVLGIFVGFVLLATFYHLNWLLHRKQRVNYNINKQNDREVYQELLLSFSLIKNVKQLIHIKTTESNLSCIAGIRFLSMVFVIAAHSLVFIIAGPVLNEEFYLGAVKKPENSILVNNALLVDTFLLLGAFLICRILLLELDKRKGKINFAVLYLARYIRLTPSYLVVIGFYCTFLQRIDNGPLWDDVILTQRDRCLKSWWTNLLYINNYVNTNDICMFQSWYLSADTQLFVMAPFVIYPLWKWPRFGEILLGIFTFTACFVPFIITYIYELDPTLMGYPREMTDITTNYYFVFAYIKTHMRAISYCIGLVAGYIVHKVHSSNLKLSNNVMRFSWVLAIIFGLSSLFSLTAFYQPEHEYNALESAAYSTLHKLAWSMSIAWIIIACVTDNSEPVRRFLSWPPFTVLSRLTYCAYLVNGLIELHSLGTVRTPTYLSIYSMASSALAHFILTFTAGFILCVLFESPIHNIEKIILRNELAEKDNQEVTSVTTNC